MAGARSRETAILRTLILAWFFLFPFFSASSLFGPRNTATPDPPQHYAIIHVHYAIIIHQRSRWLAYTATTVLLQFIRDILSPLLDTAKPITRFLDSSLSSSRAIFSSSCRFVFCSLPFVWHVARFSISLHVLALISNVKDSIVSSAIKYIYICVSAQACNFAYVYHAKNQLRYNRR